jgi:hypothetical protein
MSITLSQLHDLMDAHTSNREVGVAFSIKFLLEQITEQVRRAQAAAQALSFPTALPKINATLELDTSSLRIDLVGSDITLSGFQPVVVLKEPLTTQRPYNRIRMDFDPVTLRIDTGEPGEELLRFYVTTAIPAFNVFPGSPDLAVITDNGMTLAEYEARENAALAAFLAVDVLFEFVGSLPLPRVIAAMRTIGIDRPYNVRLDSGYVLVSGRQRTLADHACECGPGVGVKIESRTTFHPATSGGSFEHNRTAHRVEIPPTAPDIDPPLAYYYPRSTSFEVLANSVVGPGIAATDSGQALMFRWFYQAFARPRSIRVTLNTTVPSIIVDAPMDVGGGAGVSMKVGCVSVPLLHSLVRGSVDPCTFKVEFTIVETGSGSAIVAYASLEARVEVEFFNPPMIDILLNILMGSIGNRLVAQELGRMANRLSFRLVDLNDLALEAPFGWLLRESVRPESALLSFNPNQG